VKKAQPPESPKSTKPSTKLEYFAAFATDLYNLIINIISQINLGYYFGLNS